MYPELAKGFKAVAIDAEIAKVFEIDRSYGFAPVSIDYIFGLHGVISLAALRRSKYGRVAFSRLPSSSSFF